MFLNETEPHFDPKLLNPLSLAYMGDAVLEIYIRAHLLKTQAGKPHRLHREATRYVSAKAQSAALQKLKDELTENETWFIKRGRNAKSGTTPKNTDLMDYRNSSGLECLLGYLYLADQRQRLQELLQKIVAIIEVGDNDE
ncbi:ribonuclease III [Ammoniphilus oxalaticus]|uniref:Mini-ribonuclease 3 n=2 Tax=Ammoniphilus oxalaticus TaxID=66863 RepID=A0A419SHE7_9BACL|nr:Mini-ribonuclease 3 [Ammoniphilus oxalaticus]RKD23208.1 ribonuclease III [Ammoniphilus oxalaticus]